jgi:RNA polymerase-binding transcription factor DksA
MASAKKPTGKPSAKKAPAKAVKKSAPVKKAAPAKKAPTKKAAPAKKAPTKKAAPAKKAPAKKAAPAKKVAAKKAPVKKVVAKPAKKTATKPASKIASKKAAPAKKATTTKKSTSAPKPVVKKKAVAKPAKKTVAKPSAKPAPVKKAPTKKPVASKPAPAKKAAPTKKPVASKPATTKPAASKPEPKASSKPASVKPAEPEVVAPEVIEEVVPVATKPRGRNKGPLNPEDIPPPVPLLHQPGIEDVKALPQKDTRPKEKARVQDDDSMWTGAELKQMRTMFTKELVEREKALVLAQETLDQLISFSDDGAGSETADTGNSTLEREFQISLVEKAQENVDQTLQALSRLDSKIYGLCENCGKSIGKLRLMEANPYATLCFECKTLSDKGLI